jgi:N-acyl-D-amino-acid deacylase
LKNSIPRRRFIKTSALATAALSTSGFRFLFAGPPLDIIIKDAHIVDGTGGEIVKADLGVIGDRITVIGDLSARNAKKIIPAEGWHVCPGFIDIHTHSDGSILVYPEAESRVMQGVTTEITGNCGYSAAPLQGHDARERRKKWLEEDGVEAKWSDVASYFETLEKTGISVNHALLLGQGTLRNNLIGSVNRELTTDEMNMLLATLEEGLDQGALGLSTGLEYVPGSFTSTDELIIMARVLARRGGLYASHIRDEETFLLEAVNEAIEIGRQSGVRVQISHLKAAGRSNWYKQEAALHLIESARRQGIDVMADAYPYTAYSTSLSSFILPWAREGGNQATMQRLADPAVRDRIRKESEEIVRTTPGDYHLIVISRVKSEKNQSLVGKNIAEIAAIWNIEPVDVLLRLLEEEEGSVGFIGHGMSPENVDMVLKHPLVMIGSDGSSMAPRGRAAQTRPHPRSYGSFARVLGYYQRERNLFDLASAVKKMTAMPADQCKLDNRGRIARGKKADLVIFDASTVVDKATFDQPHQYPLGIEYVLVNGQIVVEKGKHTGKRPGRVLRST